MRLAVFTSEYPGRVVTFFERDMRALLEAGVEIDIFPIYPLDPANWGYSSNLLNAEVLPREKIHHLSLGQTLRSMRPMPLGTVGTLLRDAAAIGISAVRYGAGPLAKSAYVMLKAWVWARQFADKFDHVLAYWGNYAATC